MRVTQVRCGCLGREQPEAAAWPGYVTSCWSLGTPRTLIDRPTAPLQARCKLSWRAWHRMPLAWLPPTPSRLMRQQMWRLRCRRQQRSPCS